MNSSKQLVLKTSEKYLGDLIEQNMNAVPTGFNKDRFIQNALVVLKDTKDIEKCEPASIARTLLKGAFLGLDFFQRECYAIPYGNKLQFQTDYKGETKMAKKYSIRPIKDIYAKVVRKEDEFTEEIIGGKQSVTFKPISFNTKPIIGAFAVVLYKDGGMEYETMSKEEIEDIRNNFSKMKNGLMWTKTPGEAYKKTVLRRLTKKIEKDFSNLEQAQTYQESSDMQFKEEKKAEKAVDPFKKEVVEEKKTEEEIKEVPFTDVKKETDKEKEDELKGTPFEVK